MERTIFIDASGTEYLLTDPPWKAVISEEGTGIPEIEYITQQGPFQHGESVEDYFLKPRELQLVIRQNFDCRQKYWEGRQALINMVRPNKGLGVLRKILNDGTKRDIDVYIESGPGYTPGGNGWSEWSIQEVLRFTAHNPVYYNPTVYSTTFSAAGTSLTFPITFPISFPAIGLSKNIVYNGNWLEYPTITITGPVTNPTVTNVTTGEKLSLACTVAPGISVTFSLTYGNKTITSSLNDDYIIYLTYDSDLATFHLKEATTNVLTVAGSGITPATNYVVSWKERFIGI